MFSLDKILLPVDFSELCLGAARHAVPRLAKQFNSEVTVLHVLAPYSSEFGGPGMGIPFSGDLVTGMKDQARRALDSFLSEELRDVSVKRVLVEGDPARKIVEHAHSENFGLIMMPTHGYGPFRRLLLGSVTSKVLHDADCPVWTGVHFEKVRHRCSHSPRWGSSGRPLGPSDPQAIERYCRRKPSCTGHGHQPFAC